eukprot:8126040-Lingulodinium_polyedra.AAC.1
MQIGLPMDYDPIAQSRSGRNRDSVEDSASGSPPPNATIISFTIDLSDLVSNCQGYAEPCSHGPAEPDVPARLSE